MACKCNWGNVDIKPDGMHSLDPCVYEDIEMYANVTVIVSRCKNCGHIELSWMRQENTEEIPIGETDDDE